MKKVNVIKGIREALLIIGFVMFGYGIYYYSPAIMCIVCGGLIVVAVYPKGVKTVEPDK